MVDKKKSYSRRDFLKVAGIGAAGLSLGGCLSNTESTIKTAQKNRWNILWLSCEDISPDLGCCGDKYADTPNLDRLAGEGCRYTNAFAPYPVCAPTRSSVITGMYPSTIGSMHMRTRNRGYQTVPPPYVKCFTEYLRAAGYYCTNQSKTDYQFKSPFTAWDQSHRKADWRSRPEGTPFFSVINLTTTHESRCWEKEGETLIHDPSKVTVPPFYPDTPIVRRTLARYYDNITKMDKQAGEYLQRLEEDGLADNTVVFFWSDHGRGMPRHKRWVYDTGIHVPLIVRWPGRIKPGGVCDDMVMLTDLGPSVLSIADVKIPSHIQGKAFLGEQKKKNRKYIVAGRERMDNGYCEHIRAVRDKRLKYIRNFTSEKPYVEYLAYRDDNHPIMKEWRRMHAEGKLKGPQKLFFQKTKPPEEFYDIVEDRYEINNLINSPKHQQIIAKMRTRLDKWIKKTGDLGGMDEDELIERMWPGKKYPETAEPVISIIDKSRKKVKIEISCPTKGASIGYKLGENRRWLLYSEPFTLEAGTVIRAKAIRYGYKTSEEVIKIL